MENFKKKTRLQCILTVLCAQQAIEDLFDYYGVELDELGQCLDHLFLLNTVKVLFKKIHSYNTTVTNSASSNTGCLPAGNWMQT